jgi:hypothetical protein
MDIDAGRDTCPMRGDGIQHRGGQWCDGNRHAETEYEEGQNEGRPPRLNDVERSD